MKYLFIPGNSLRNKEWIDSLAKEFSNEKIVIHYDHWKKGEESIDFNIELKKLEKLPNDKYIIVAKSIGCLLAIKAIEKDSLRPEICFFIGFPLFSIENRYPDIKELIDNDIKTTFIQKTYDPQASYEKLKKEINNIRSSKYTKLIEYKREDEPNDNHYYANTKYLKDLILKN